METQNSKLTDIIFAPCQSSPELVPLYASPLLIMQRVCNEHTRLVSVTIDRENAEIENRQFMAVCDYAVQHAASVVLWNPLVYVTEEAFRSLQASEDAVALIPAVYTKSKGKKETREMRAWTVDSTTHKFRRIGPADEQASICDFGIMRIKDVCEFGHFFSRSCPWTKQMCETVNAYLYHHQKQARIIKPYGMYLG